MPSAIEAIVADAGPLIAFARIDGLGWLPRLFDDVWVTPEVIAECLARPERHDARAIQSALDAGVLRCRDAPSWQTYAEGLGAGESSTMALARQQRAAVLIDDRLARRVANELGLRVVGTLGVLVALKLRGHLPTVRPALEELVRSGYFLSGPVIAEALRRAGEGDMS